MRPVAIGTRRPPHESSPGSFVWEITMKLFKQFLALAMITVALTSLTACNTVHGAGKDIERGGEHLQDASH